MPFIFQYGSNCDADRLNGPNRLGGDAHDLRRALTLEEFEIAFNKRRQESGSAAADLIKPRKGRRRIWGVLYEVANGWLRAAENNRGSKLSAKEHRRRRRNRCIEESKDLPGQTRCTS